MKTCPNRVAFGLFFLALTLFGSCAKRGPDLNKIGVINSLTGSAGPYGQNAQAGIELAVEEINKSGGIQGREVALITEDDRTEPQRAVSAFNKLVDVDRVPIVIGPLSSNSALACAPLADQRRTVILSSGAAAPGLTDAGDYVFRNRAPGQFEAIRMADFAFGDLALRTMAVFYINTDYGVGFKKYLETHFDSLGGRINYTDSFEQGQTDFRAQIAKLKNSNPDGVYILGVPVEVGTLLKQAAEMGFRTKFLMNNMEDPNLIRVAGKAAEGIYYSIPELGLDTTDSKPRSFLTAFRNKYNRSPDMFASDGYDAVFLVKEAIERSKYDGESIKNALYGIKNYPGVNGTITFDKNGDVVKPLAVKTVKNGQFILYKVLD